jgi:uncharacterized protein
MQCRLDTRSLSAVQAIYVGVAQGDFQAVLDLLAPDIIVHQAAVLPMGGIWRGRKGFSAMAETINRAWPGFSVTPTGMFGNGDEVIVLARISGAAGALDQQMIEYWRVRDGQATECRPFYFDPAAAATAATFKRGI